jgi:hypothetical protein
MHDEELRHQVTYGYINLEEGDDAAMLHEEGNANLIQNIKVRYRKEKRILSIFRHKWEANIKIYLKIWNEQ